MILDVYIFIVKYIYTYINHNVVKYLIPDKKIDVSLHDD